MRILKILTHDIILFCLNLVVLIFIWFNFVNFDLNNFIEILVMGILYYLISLVTSFTIVFLLYLQVKNSFKKCSGFFYKLGLVSSIFSEYFDEICSVEDFELKIKEIY